MVVGEWKNLGNAILFEKLEKLKFPLRKWKLEVFRNIDSKIKRFEEEVSVVEIKMENGE